MAWSVTGEGNENEVTLISSVNFLVIRKPEITKNNQKKPDFLYFYLIT